MTTSSAPDTLLPGRAHDNLLPVRRDDPARRRRFIALAVVGATLALSGWSAARVVFGGGDTAPPAISTARRQRAESLLRSAADAARTVYMQRGTYHDIAATTGANRSRDITVVGGSTNARNGEVSIAADGSDMLVLATPGGGGTCVFARDEPTASKLTFAAATKKACQAEAAPRNGWTEGEATDDLG
jgi:hypothetical protein